MKYHVTEFSGETGRERCVIDANSPLHALMCVDGIDYAREWPYSDGLEGSGSLDCPDDPHRCIVADPMPAD